VVVFMPSRHLRMACRLLRVRACACACAWLVAREAEVEGEGDRADALSQDAITSSVHSTPLRNDVRGCLRIAERDRKES